MYYIILQISHVKLNYWNIFSESNELPAISDLFLNLIKYGSDVVKSVNNPLKWIQLETDTFR